MSKKLVISLSILFGLIVVVLILFWTLFGLSSVSVSFDSTIKNLSISENEIIEVGGFRKGACVLFEGKKSSIKKIENYASKNSNFAYLKVVNIETVFPNKFVVHVEEREELFSVKTDENFLVCDREFRVLKIVEDFQSTPENAILLEGLDFENQDIKTGDFLQLNQTSMKNFCSVMIENNRTIGQQTGKFKSLVLENYIDSNNNNKYIKLILKTFQNKKYEINNIDFAFSAKVRKLFNVESSLYSHKVDSYGNFIDDKNEIIYVKKLATGEYVSFVEGDEQSEKVALSMSLLAKCFLKIDNLTLSEFVERTDKDVFYSIVEDKTV